MSVPLRPVNYPRVRGLAKLVEAAIDQGTRAVERIHKGTAARPFAILERIPPVAGPAYVVHVVHDGISSAVYTSVRVVNKVTFGAVGLALDAAEAVDPTSTRD